MATEQAFYGLVAAQRTKQGKKPLYDMRDVSQNNLQIKDSMGHGNTIDQSKPVMLPDKTFQDILGEDMVSYRQAIEELASHKIMSGKSDKVFDPMATMTRAEFAACLVRGLGLSLDKGQSHFVDVPDKHGIANM